MSNTLMVVRIKTMCLLIEGMPMASRQKLATTAEVAEYLDRPVATLRQWRWLNRGPRWVKIGKSVRYRWSDIDAYVDEQTRGAAA